ncbi:dehydrogenase/reductase SDR family member 8 precursor [Patellaria atrata CBS 101060]|uniref:Short-chain dehydrogenase/reductase 3 n=1 Tax=Patellaria atrata CBS 101060 TaxID=1346257 RepID=A0A9P4SEM3_9PEZI|nr:dehydrogenase/reductase SDR family member 8 precursor [Patellaria atrata CBS 101060]
MTSLIRAVSTASDAALSPAITGLLLYVLTKGPESLRQPFVRGLSTPDNVNKAITTLKWLLGLGLVKHVNRFLSDWALNNWELKRQKWNWKEEIVLITGGSGGIGSLIAKGLALKGLQVVVVDVIPMPEGLQGWANISFQQCDITSIEALKEMAEVVRSSVGEPTILINNAGVFDAHSILDTNPDYLRKVFDVNVLSNWYLIQQFLPGMIKKNKGHVLTMASLSSYLGVAGFADYSATKAGVLALHEALTSELRLVYGAPQVKTSIFHPSYVKSPMSKPWEKALKDKGLTLLDASHVANAVVKHVMSGRSGHFIIPAGASSMSSWRGYPVWLQEFLRGKVGFGSSSLKMKDLT